MKKYLLYFIIFLLLLIYVFRSLLFNLSTHLIDWRDYPYYVWVIFQNIQKIKTLDFIHFFDTTAFYPHKMTLLFSDILLPQSLMALPFSFFIDNPILVFNIVFFITFILDYVSVFLLWKQIFKKDISAFLATLTTCFLLMNIEIAHFQMMSFWPLFLCLYLFFKNEKKYRLKNLIYAGILLSVQFLASIYMSIFLLTGLGIFFLVSFLFYKNKFSPIKNSLIVLMIFLLLDGIFIKGYLDMKKSYQIKRSINEYIGYSAHLTDYLFISRNTSLLNSTGLIVKWNKLNKNIFSGPAVSPGFLLTLLAFFGLFSLKKEKDNFSISLICDRTRLFFLLMLIVGFVFSLGPRINFNGNYAHLPAPYGLLLKYIPLFEAIRAPARWSYLFYIGIIYFAINYLNSINIEKKKNLKWLIVFLILLEYMPLPIKTHSEIYLTKDYDVLKQICSKEKKVLLELPVTHFSVKSNSGIAGGLNYIAKTQLASLYHGCYLINGYSGYDLPELINLDINANEYLKAKKYKQLTMELKKLKVDYVKVNYDKISVSNNKLRNELNIYGGLKRITSSIFSVN